MTTIFIKLEKRFILKLFCWIKGYLKEDRLFPFKLKGLPEILLLQTGGSHLRIKIQCYRILPL